jgi:uncharacterized protein (UPF0297 family)
MAHRKTMDHETYAYNINEVDAIEKLWEVYGIARSKGVNPLRQVVATCTPGKRQQGWPCTMGRASVKETARSSG